MLNKKIASEIAVGVILLLAIVMGGIFWMQGKNSATNNSQSPTNNQEEKKPIQEDVVSVENENQQLNKSDEGEMISKSEIKAEDTITLYNEGISFLKLRPLDRDKNSDKWNYEISWDGGQVKKGSFLVRGAAYIADMGAQGGKFSTGYNLQSNMEYEVTYYSENHKKGKVIFVQYFKTPNPFNLSSVAAIKNSISGDKTENEKDVSTSASDVTPVASSIQNQNQTPISKCKVRSYQDKFYNGVGENCIDKISIKGVYLVPKDQKNGIKAYWEENMLKVFGQTKEFYEKQFDNKIKITIDAPTLIFGDKNLEEYSNQLEVEQDVRNKVAIDTKDNFVVLMIYPIQGENEKHFPFGVYGGGRGLNHSSSALNSWFWLDTESLGTVTTKMGTDYSGFVDSAHEFGHALGIPHPWEEAINKDEHGNVVNSDFGNDEIGSLMSYTGKIGPLISKAFIRQQVKQKMIAP